MVVLTLILLVLAYLVYDWYKKTKHSNIPGPKCIPVLGNALEFFANEDFLQILQTKAKIYGNIFRLWLGPDFYVVLLNPEDIEVLLNSTTHIQKAVSYDFVRSWLGNGLITSHEHSASIIYKYANTLKKCLENEVEYEKFDVHTYIEKCSLDIICETAMSISMEVQTSEKADSYLKAVKCVTNMSVSRMFKIWLQPEILFNALGYGKTFDENLQIMETVSKNVIVSRRKELLEKTNDENNEAKNKQFLDFMLLESKFNDDEIRDEVRSFMFAGHDTTTTAICFCICQLAKYPDVQEKVRQEVNQILGSPDESSYCNLQKLGSLRYMENVIRETLRLYPTVPMIGRYVLEDIKLPSGYTLPAYTNINIFIYQIQRNPKIFKNPEEFIPERFDDEGIKKHPFSFIPFSAGPRNCIGQKLAMLEIKILLSILVQNYVLLATEELHSMELTAELILRVKGGIPIKLKKRSN